MGSGCRERGFLKHESGLVRTLSSFSQMESISYTPVPKHNSHENGVHNKHTHILILLILPCSLPQLVSPPRNSVWACSLYKTPPELQRREKCVPDSAKGCTANTGSCEGS